MKIVFLHIYETIIKMYKEILQTNKTKINNITERKKRWGWGQSICKAHDTINIESFPTSNKNKRKLLNFINNLGKEN